ncbi:sulfotransferase family protein [Bacillus piscicola]|uniref:sulfotransferase family protein n=1 Tax=Bacillus piscicola TaxID=1632684 RepID=UPI001F09EBB6|nr:sulfotransferase [Bacillus piscicola]
MHSRENIFKNKLKGLTSYYLFDMTRSLFNFNKAYPLNSNQIAPFFIIGSGRSGNTLLRSMLVEGEGIVIPPESYVLGNVIRKYYALSHFKNIQWNEICAITLAIFDGNPEFKWWDVDVWKVYERCKNLDHKNRNLASILDEIYKEYATSNGLYIKKWGDKTPLNTFYLKEIYKTFPEAKFIHIIRDGRDVAVSYKNANLYQSLEESCERWNISINEIDRFSKTISSENMFEVKYEMLVNNTTEELTRLCEFLEIKYKDSMLNRSKTNQLGDVSGHSHHENVKNPINTSSIGKWRSELGEQDKETVNNLCYKNLKKLGYV